MKPSVTSCATAPRSLKIFDLSPRISERTAVFPGDTPFSRERLMSFEQGANLELSTIRSTVHLGAHADAPRHYHPQGQTIEQRDLSRYLGPAQVIRVSLPRGERVRPEHLAGREILAPRVLLQTGSFPDPDRWNSDFNSLSPELIEHLHAHGVVLVGIDTPSIDPEQSKALESHQAVYRHDLAVLEGLILQEVPEGVYQLSALPLPIVGGDASPVRAVLWEEAQP